MIRTILALSLALLAGCFATVPPKGYAPGDLAGSVDGQEWHYKHAYVDPTVRTPNEDDVLFVFLPAAPKDRCPRTPELAEDHRTIMVAAPQELKQVKIKAGTQRNLVFQYDDASGGQVAKSAKKGKIKITSVTKERVVGKLYARYDDSNWVSGNFSAVVCNSLDLR